MVPTFFFKCDCWCDESPLAVDIDASIVDYWEGALMFGYIFLV